MEPAGNFIQKLASRFNSQDVDKDMSDGRFTDSTFPNTDNTLCERAKGERDYSDCEFKRISDVRGADLALFGDINPRSIDQGALGTCYLLAALAELAESPDRIKKLFKTQEVSPEGMYVIKMYKNGVPVEIVVDDYIPWFKDRKTPLEAFSRGKGSECWVQLVEKAYAKLHGSYDRVWGG